MPLNRLGSVEKNSLLIFVTKYCQNKHENYSRLPQLLPFIWMGCFFSSYRISASRTTWNVACYFTTPNPASDISCSISSPLAPFLQKTNLQNHSMASAQGHKLFWHQQPAEKCLTSEALNNCFSNGRRLKRLQILHALAKKYLFAAAREKRQSEHKEEMWILAGTERVGSMDSAHIDNIISQFLN